MRRLASFAAASAALIGLLLVVLVLVFPAGEVRRALCIVAGVAFVVQLVAFAVARRMAARRNVIAGWGIGVALRFAALALFALVAAPRLGLPLTSSLMGLAVFLFVSTLIEPLFLAS